MPGVQAAKPPAKVTKLADMLSAMGSEPRLRILQLLLSAHPDGLVVTEIQDELARIIHIFEDNKSLLCYKHVV